MKILAIGNSFSEDATRYIQNVAKSAGEDLYVRNCFIGGCSLEMHVRNIESGEEAYAYQNNSVKERMISITDALCAEDWDYVTIQQVSGYSGILESYEPYMGMLVDHIKQYAKRAEIVFHRTWAYEIDSCHSDFPKYNKDQNEMYEKICSASEKATERYSMRIIKCGDAVQEARKLQPFDYKNGGLSLCRDGFHMTGTYGRYLLALVWFRFFTGKSAHIVTYAPEGTDNDLIEMLRDCADKF